jgi:hypothetical protein
LTTYTISGIFTLFFQVQTMVNVMWVYDLKLCLNFGFDYINPPFYLVFVIDVTKRGSWKILPCFRFILELLHGLLSLEQRAREWVQSSKVFHNAIYQIFYTIPCGKPKWGTQERFEWQYEVLCNDNESFPFKTILILTTNILNMTNGILDLQEVQKLEG